MKFRSFFTMSVALVIVALAADAYAFPPFKALWDKTYLGDGANADLKAAAAEAKCNVCHVGTKKKDKNAYGNALHDLGLHKPLVDKLKDGSPDKEATEKLVLEALKKAEEKKNADGKTFGELIKSGKLPG